jgi:hypothetical protein
MPLLFEFPYVCPEPVLVTCSFIYINGSKRPFLLTTTRPAVGEDLGVIVPVVPAPGNIY